MARVDVQTDDAGNNEIALIVSEDEIKIIVSTWDIPITIKQALI